MLVCNKISKELPYILPPLSFSFELIAVDAAILNKVDLKKKVSTYFFFLRTNKVTLQVMRSQ